MAFSSALQGQMAAAALLLLPLSLLPLSLPGPEAHAATEEADSVVSRGFLPAASGVVNSCSQMSSSRAMAEFEAEALLSSGTAAAFAVAASTTSPSS
jgi:hypothetical protein